MKSVLISTRPKWCGLIASGRKPIEVRKTRPKIETPFKCYIYATKATKWFRSGIILTSDELLWLSNGKIKMCDGFELWAEGEDYQCVNSKVIGEFICDNVEVLFDTNGNPENYMTDILPSILQKTALSYDEFGAYIGSRADKNSIYGWHISDLKIYDKPKELSEFAVADKEAIRQCEYREQSYYAFTDTGYIKNGFYCKEKDDWCFGCKRKPLARAPQSWCYVEVYK